MSPNETWHFPNQHIGQTVLVFDQLSSTNDHASQLASNPALAGTVVVARHQTAGRGQHGRIWTSQPSGSLLLSVLLFPPLQILRPIVLTAWACTAVTETVRDCANIEPWLKWPNDIYIGSRKLCGILVEKSVGTVIGIGLNLNQSAHDFENAGLPQATSLHAETGFHFELRDCLERLLQRLDTRYSQMLRDDLSDLKQSWKSRFPILGRSVRAVLIDGTEITGKLVGMDFHVIQIEVTGESVKAITPEFIRHLSALESSAIISEASQSE